MFKTYSSYSSLVITSRWLATSRLRAPVSVRLVYSKQECAHFCSEWYIMGDGTGALWDLWDCSNVSSDDKYFPTMKSQMLSYTEVTIYSHFKTLIKAGMMRTRVSKIIKRGNHDSNTSSTSSSSWFVCVCLQNLSCLIQADSKLKPCLHLAHI